MLAIPPYGSPALTSVEFPYKGSTEALPSLPASFKPLFDDIMGLVSTSKIPVIGIGGCPGVGKTTMTNLLARQLRNKGIRCAIVRFDDWTNPESLRQEGYFNLRGVHEFFGSFLEGKRVIEKPVQNEFTDEYSHEVLDLTQVDLILFEGLLAISEKEPSMNYAQYCDRRIFVEASQEDIACWKRGRPTQTKRTDKEFSEHMQAVFQYHRENIEPFRAHASWIVTKNSDHGYSLSIPSSGVALEHVSRVDTCLSAWFSGRTVAIKPFHRGHNSVSCYRLENGGIQYVLRLLPLDISGETIERQLYMIRESARLGLSPEVFAVENRAVLMEYIDAPTLTPAVARQNAEAIGASLRKIHAIPRNPHVDSTRYLDGAEARYRLIQGRSGFPDTTEAIQLIRTGSEQLSTLRANIHGDLHPHNGFWTKRGLCLIDWERTLWEHPYLDLARFAMSLALDAESEKRLVQGYFSGIPTEEEKEQYLLAKRLNWANMAIMCLKIAAVMLDQQPGLSINPDHPIGSWSSYMEAFAVTDKTMPVQFFYDAGKSAFQHLHEASPL